jgi:hypothetical protein
MSQLPALVVASLRRNVIALAALFLALGAGGGYAIAAANHSTIHGCVNNRTHALFIQARCHRGQHPLTWDKQPATSQPLIAWAAVQANGFLGAGAQGISVDHTSAGTYQVTATPSACADVTSAPVVTVDTSNPPPGGATGGFPQAWEVHQGSGRNTFTVYTGVVTGGSFAPADEAFNVTVPCS